MRSSTSLCNMALSLIGGKRISSIDETSNEAIELKLVFFETLDSVLSEHDFNEAMYTAELALLEETPAFKYTYKHQLPVEPYCLRVLNLYDSNENEILDYKVEGRTVSSDENVLYINYIARLEDYNNMSPLLVEAFTHLLASKVCKSMASDTSLSNTLFEKYRIALLKAKNNDAMEERRDVYTDANYSWLNCRGY